MSMKNIEKYLAKIQAIEQELGMQIAMDRNPLDDEGSVNRFIADVKKSEPDGLLLIPFKKGHWPHVVRIVEQTKIPTIVLATLGILLVGHVRELHRKPGVYMINSLNNLDAVEQGMRMIRTASWMKQSCILNIARAAAPDRVVSHLG